MSVFNGARYLGEQIDSILAQKDVAVSLYVRDDGSTDETARILRTYEAKHDNVHVIGAANVGVTRSFLSMLQLWDFDADYFAFSDADDVWRPEKLAQACRHIESNRKQTPVLYCGQLEFVDENLKHLGWGMPVRRPLGVENALVESRASGATSVFNRRAYEVLCRYSSQRAVLHDAWVYLVISAFGNVIFDARAFIRYRQHGANAIGGKPSAFIR